ncbi:MAG TPA: hypothetical protein VFM90_08430 [Cyclobacteriaceae bacterium]|nr:hypothetical protein [Cyclobacteriaceae bacterium]
MSKSKKIFLGIAIVFFLALFYASYDISTRTTFPGSKPQLKERLEKKYLPSDTLTTDSAARVAR